MPRILVVDDEEDLLSLVSAVLGGAGYEVFTANSGQSALDLLEQEKVDLVLLDVMMPEMDGWAVVREMKNRPQIEDMPIAMLTVKSISPDNFYSNEVESISDYINKPFSKKELLERVKQIFAESERIEAIKKKLKPDAPEFIKEYEGLSKAQRLYENLMGSLEYSLSRMKTGTHDYNLLKDAIDYGKVLLERIREKKEGYEKLIEKD
jgi:DNA-binding response OmpR family regulator